MATNGGGAGGGAASGAVAAPLLWAGQGSLSGRPLLWWLAEGRSPRPVRAGKQVHELVNRCLQKKI